MTECVNDDLPVAGPDESLCARCLARERSGVALPNRRLHAYRAERRRQYRAGGRRSE